MQFKKALLISLFSFIFIHSYAVEGRPKIRRACLNRNDSIIDLQWYRPNDNCGSFTNFNIYGRYSSLIFFELLYSSTNYNTNSVSFKLKNLLNWEFYIVYNKTCNGLDSVSSDTLFIDNSRPFNQEIDSVSVDLATQKIIIGWTKNPTTDTKGYYVYNVIQNSTKTNKKIYDTSSTSLIDYLDRDPKISSYEYTMAAYDSCGNASPISDSHTSIFLSGQINPCPNKTIVLNWSPYSGWPIEEYEIYLNINGVGYKKIGTVDPLISSFTYNFQSFGSTYCFFIRARKKNSTVSSSSNAVCFTANSILESRNSYVAKASVQHGDIELVLVTETGKSIQKLNVYKAINNGGFSLWQIVPFTGGTLNLLDNNVNTQINTYRYYFTTEGPCSNIFDTSQIAETILLNVLMIQPGNQNLTWSLYNDFIKNTESQQVLLSNDPNFDKSSTWNILSTENNTSIAYNDATNFGTNQEQICYCIRAIENNPSLTYNRKDTSYSNIQCLTADPIVFFPNAIQLNGFNTVFKPKGVFIDYEKSSFTIYNKWGQIVYETNDIQTGWNGLVNNELVQSDVYAYTATIIGINGKILTFDGTLTVLK